MRQGERLPDALQRTLRDRARTMRKAMSPAEVRLWGRIRGDQLGGLRFRRQHVIGPYIADFFCPALNLVIEVDGDSHFEPEQEKWDADRTSYLKDLGLREIRFTNVDVLTNSDAILAEIARVAGLD